MTNHFFVRFLCWCIAKIGWVTILSLSLLIFIFGIVVYGLTETIRGVDSEMLFLLAFMGLLFGWWLGRFRLTWYWIVLAAIILGVGIIFFRVGHLGDPATRLFRSLANIKILEQEIWVDWDPALLALKDFSLSFGTLITRTSHWIWKIARGERSYDPIAIAIFWGLIIWGLATWGAIVVRRYRRPLLATFPAGALLAGMLNFAHHENMPIIPLMGAILLLMALVRYTDREKSWIIRGIDYSEDLRLEYFFASGALTIILIGTAAIAPSLSIKNITNFTQRLLQRTPGETRPITESLGLLNREEPASDDFSELYTTGLPRRHLLGSGPELSEKIVMSVETGDSVLEESPIDGISIPGRYYWRSLTYDRYLGTGWGTGKTEAIKYSANQTTFTSENINVIYQNPLRKFVRQVVKSSTELGGILYHTGMLITIDNDYQVAWRRAPINQITSDQTTNTDPFGALTSTNAYQVVSALPNVGVDQLRSAGEDYPGWVTERYLYLPGSVPDRVISLALDLTATEPTPYDRAKAIERYLRDIPYDLDIPAPPLNRDVVDYFIFDLDKGYCDYYATAMVVLARAAGLPSRLVIGYASGLYDADHNRYIVTEADAHSWPEIYFPEIGWIEFEPTAGQPALEYPQDIPLREIEEITFSLPISPGVPKSNPLTKIMIWIGLIFLSIPMIILTWFFIDIWRLDHLEPTISIKILYRRFYRLGRRILITERKGDTPNEFAASLGNTILSTANGKRWENSLKPAMQEVDQITEIYSRSIYSEHNPLEEERSRAIKAWSSLRWRLLLSWFSRKASKC